MVVNCETKIICHKLVYIKGNQKRLPFKSTIVLTLLLNIALLKDVRKSASDYI